MQWGGVPLTLQSKETTGTIFLIQKVVILQLGYSNLLHQLFPSISIRFQSAGSPNKILIKIKKKNIKSSLKIYFKIMFKGNQIISCPVSYLFIDHKILTVLIC